MSSIFVEATDINNQVLICQPVLQEFKFFRKIINFLPREAVNNSLCMFDNFDLFGEIQPTNELPTIKLLFNSIIKYLNKPSVVVDGVTYIPKNSVIDLEKLTIVTPSIDGTSMVVVIKGYDYSKENLIIDFDLLNDLPKDINFNNLPISFIPITEINTNKNVRFQILKYKLVSYSMYSLFNEHYTCPLIELHKKKYKL